MPEKRGRRIGPTVVGTAGPGLADDVKEQLRNIAKSKAAPTANLDAFIKLVDTAASQYWTAKSLQDQALPKTVRREIKAAHDASRRLIERVNDLGGASRHLLYAEGSPGTHERFGGALMRIAQQLRSARNHAEDLSKSAGAPLSYAKTSLAAMVAHAIETRLAVKPTMTRDGLFEEVLKTVIEAVEKRDDPSVRDLMRAALQARVTGNPDGVIGIESWVE
jgi:hypothetical protein